MNIRTIIVMGATSVAFLSVAAPTVTLNKVQQRYPWNGLVDIDYEIAGISAGETDGLQLEVRAKDEMSKAEFVAVKGLQYAPPVTAGKHRVTWNTAADNAIIYSSNVTVTVTLKKPKVPPLYVVIDLSTPDSYGINYLDAEPSGGWTDEYKTSKLVLRRIEAGQFVMGAAETYPVNPHDVTLTRPYYIGVFEVTYEQWKRVTGKALMCPLSGERDHMMQPVINVAFDQVRGADKGGEWPMSNDVDAASFLGSLRQKTGLKRLDLPTEAQWEFASKGGTDSRYGSQDVTTIADTKDRFRRTNSLSGNVSYDMSLSGPTVLKDVGMQNPNLYGLYGCLGGAAEWCLDWYDSTYVGSFDPCGPQVGEKRVVRGGSFCDLGSEVSTVKRESCASGLILVQEVIKGWAESVAYYSGWRPITVEFEIAGFRVCYHGEL